MAIGAAGLFTTYTQLIVMVVIGICQGMQPIVGYNYGAGKFHRMKRAYRLAVAAASVLCCLGAAIGIAMPRMVARIFNPDPELIAATERCLQLALLAFFVVGCQFVYTIFRDAHSVLTRAETHCGRGRPGLTARGGRKHSCNYPN